MSADLKVGGTLYIEANDVTLNLNGHTLTTAGASAVSIKGRSGVTIDGQHGTLLTASDGAIRYTDDLGSMAGSYSKVNGPFAGILVSGEGNGVTVKDVSVKVAPTNQTQTASAMFGILASDSAPTSPTTGGGGAGKMTLEDVDVSLDQSAYGGSSGSNSFVCGIFLGAGFADPTLTKAKVSVTPNTALAGENQSEVCGIVLGGSQAVLDQPVVNITSGRDATGIYLPFSGAAATVTGGDVNAYSPTAAYAYRAASGATMTLGGLTKASFASPANVEAPSAYGLHAEAPGAFKLAESFDVPDEAALSVLLEPATGTANPAGSTIASFDPEAGEDRVSALSGKFSDALGAAGKTAVTVTASGVGFASSDAKVASVTSGETVTEFDTLADAFAALVKTTDGTMKLLGGFDESAGIDYTQSKINKGVNNSPSYTIDMNGHDADHIYLKAYGNFTVKDTADNSFKLTGMGSTTVQNKQWALAADSYAKDTTSAMKSIHLTVEGCDIDVKDGVGGAINSTNTPLVWKGGSISVAGAPGAAVAGMMCVGTADVSDVKVSVTGDAPNDLVYAVRSASSDFKATNVTGEAKVVNCGSGDAHAYGAYLRTKGNALTASACSFGASSDASDNGQGANAYGICNPDGQADLDLTGVSASAAGGADSRSLYYGATATGKAVKMAGACSLPQGAYLGLATLSLAGDFSLAGGASSVEVESAQGLADSIFASASDDSDISAKAGLFAGAGVYRGMAAQPVSGDAAKLRWPDVASQGDVAKVGENSYDSFEAALAAAVQGDTLTLLADADAGAFEVTQPMTIDLAGHTLAVEAGTGLTGPGTDPTARAALRTAILVSAEGAVSLVDSSTGGKVDIEIDGANPTSTAGAASAGIAIKDGKSEADLKVSCPVAVSYGRETSASASASAVYGIFAPAGSVALNGSATLETRARKASELAAGYGAAACVGVQAKGAAGLEIAPKATVKAVNTSSARSGGAVYNANTNQFYGAGYASAPVYLREIFPEAGSVLYSEIQAKFRQSATFDAEGENDPLHKSNVYYAAPLTLDNGTYVWAFSDPVDPDGGTAGTAAAITATRFFTTCTYDLPATAAGVAAATGATGSVTVAGDVSASASSGEAYAIDAEGDGPVAVSAGAKLAAQGGWLYAQKDAGLMDLHDYYDGLGGDGSRVSYPKQTAVHVVEASPLDANGIAGSGKVTLGGSVSIEAAGAGAADIGLPAGNLTVGAGLALAGGDAPLTVMAPGGNAEGAFAVAGDGVTLSGAQAVLFADAGELYGTLVDGDGKLAWSGPYAPASERTVTVTGAKNASGESLPGIQFTASYGQTLGDALGGKALPAAESYTDGGTSYRFVGWTIGSTSYSKYAYYPGDDNGAVKANLAFDKTVTGTELAAAYVPVTEGQHLAQLKIDGLVLAYPVADGAAASYADAYGYAYGASPTQAAALSKIDAETGVEYVFKGWKSGLLDSADYAEASDVDYPSWLPAADADVSYTAKFASNKRAYTTTVNYYTPSDDGAYARESRYYSLPAGTDLGAYLKDKVSSFVQSGTYYALKGYSTRLSDKDPVWGVDELPAVNGDASTMTRTSGGTYYAVYAESVPEVAVTFMVKGEDGKYARYATSDGANIRSTISDAFATTGMANPALAGSYFRGWALSEDADKTVAGSATVAWEGDPSDALTATYYAVYGDAPTFTVEFVDWDNKSIKKVSGVADGATVSSTGKAPTNPARVGYYFTGWADAQDNAFDPSSTAVDRNLTVHATYKEIATSGTVSAAHVYLTADEFTGASAVNLKLAGAASADGNLAAAAASAKKSVLSGYALSLTAANGAVESPVTSGFGTAVLTLPVSGTDPVNVYWLKSDGSIGSKTGAAPSGGAVSVNVTDYEPSKFGANVVVAGRVANTMTAAAKAPSVAYSTAAQAIPAASAYSVTGAQGAVTYAKASGDAGLTVAPNGAITVAKGLAVGDHSLAVTASAAGNDGYLPSKATINLTVKVTKAANTMAAKGKSPSVTYSAAAQTIPAASAYSVTGAQGAVTYAKASGDAGLTVAPSGAITVKKGLAPGNHSLAVTATAAGNGSYLPATATVSLTVTVAKAANTMTAKGKTATVKFAKLKKASQTLSASKVLTVSKAKGAVTYKKTSGNGKITVNAKNGKVTVKKGLKKGTYAVKVSVTAAGNSTYLPSTKKNVAFKVKVS